MTINAYLKSEILRMGVDAERPRRVAEPAKVPV